MKQSGLSLRVKWAWNGMSAAKFICMLACCRFDWHPNGLGTLNCFMCLSSSTYVLIKIPVNSTRSTLCLNWRFRRRLCIQGSSTSVPFLYHTKATYKTFYLPSDDAWYTSDISAENQRLNLNANAAWIRNDTSIRCTHVPGASNW